MLSYEHKRVIDEWWQATPPSRTPELHFIITSRNLILKAGAFPAFAINSESSIGEGSNLTITGTSYELAYYDETDKRQDLEEAIRGAIRWCDQELTAIEEKLINPQIKANEDDLNFLPKIDHEFTNLAGEVGSADAKPTASQQA